MHIHTDLWTSQRHQNVNAFNYIELLTVYIYDGAIAKRKEERSMNGLKLVSLKEYNLHSMQNYLNALQTILTINKNIKLYMMQIIESL